MDAHLSDRVPRPSSLPRAATPHARRPVAPDRPEPIAEPRPAPSRLGTIAAATVGSLLILAPHAVDFAREPALGPAGVHSGDEPHYLIVINSLLGDGDLDLGNNYASVHEGSGQAGASFAPRRWLNHHTRIRGGSDALPWHAYFEGWTELDGWGPDASGTWVPPAERDDRGRLRPPFRDGSPPYPPGAAEYSYHPVGIGPMLAPLLWPLRGTRLVEPAAILCAGLAVIGAMLAFRWLLAGYTSNGPSANLIMLAAFLGTPAWFYGRSLYMEPFLLFFVVAAYAVVLRGRSALLAGALLASAMQLKPTVALLAAPALLGFAADRRWGRLGAMLAPMAASAVGVLALNATMYGSPFSPPQPFVSGDVLEGLVGLWTHARYGVLFFAPAVLVALICWPAFLAGRPRDGATLLGVFALQYVLMASWIAWHGAVAFGPRHLVPVLPLLFVPLVRLAEVPARRSRLGHALLAPLVLLGMLTNGVGAFWYERFWDAHPLIESVEGYDRELVPDALRDYYHRPRPWES